MKVSQINFYTPQFRGNKSYSTDNWIALRNELTKTNQYYFDTDEEVIRKTGNLPTFKKAHFEFSDYQKLSPKEKLIISILNKKGSKLFDDSTNRNDISIKKDAQRIFELATKIKEFFDSKYKNGYRLVGIGNSPAPIVETMKLLGADALTLPFSKYQIEQCNSREFPYEHKVRDNDFSRYGHCEKCTAKDWEEYLKFYGIDKDFSQRTGKTLIFTDYVSDGWTKKYFEAILKGLGFNKNYEFIEVLSLLPSDTKLQQNYNLFRCLDYSTFKDYAQMKSAKECLRKADIIKHPEYIPSLGETLQAKLFRCAIFDLITRK